jgi:peptidoglycan/xylan/chitin deacetylase (PgdA/CDA1 family)
MLLILAALAVLTYQQFLSWKLCLAVLLLLYWLPKFLFIAPLEKMFPDVLFRNKKQKAIALTFDDVPGPYGTTTEQIANLLDQYDVKATFFVISGYTNDENIHVLVDLVKRGHQLANHGKTNSLHFAKYQDEMETEMDDCDKLIKKVYDTAKKPLPKKMFYRPGSGWFGPTIMDAAKKFNCTVALGSTHVCDPIVPIPLLNFWYFVAHITAGDIVVLHDLPWTAPTLEYLLPWLQERKLESVTLENFVE